jgi:2-polyprenyl-3-methyl-5-hydroxy-6-metoxy-1,4-benzoquinol methylase
MRGRGEFRKWANAAAEQAIIVDAYQTRPEYRDLAEEDPRLLAQRHAAHTNVRIEGNASEWAEKAGFDGVSTLVDAIRRSVIANDVRARIACQLEALELAESPVLETGECARIAESMRTSGEELVKKLGITEGIRLLDLGCGEGSTALSAARLGAEVLGVDIASHLVDAGNKRAKEEGLANCKFQEGDASNLHELKDHTFDLVVSIFGAMFAPRPFDVAREMVRVTRPGGRIVMANWIPNDSALVAQILKISSSYSSPSAEDFISPMTWGIEDNVLARFAAAGVTKDKISFEKDTYTFNFPGAPSELVDAFSKYYGPAVSAFEAAEKSGRRDDLQDELEALFNTQNKSANKDFTSIPATFLRVAVTL